MTYRLQRVIVEGFRAYGTRTEFDCSGDVVALVGPNGWGKTSFFDAITWCLFGRIPRLTGTRDFVGAEFIRNRFSPEIPPNVSVALEGDGEAVVVARDSAGLHVATGTAEFESPDAEDWIRSLVRGQTLPDEHGPDQDENDELAMLQDDPETLFLRCHHLSQDQMAAFLRESSPRERFDTLASLLGLDVIRSFYRHMFSVSRDLGNDVEDARRQQLQLEQRLGTLRSELEEIESLDDGSSATIDRLVSEYVRLRSEAGALAPSLADEDTDVRSPADLAERVRDLALQLADLGDRMESRSKELARLKDDMQSVVEQADSATQLASSRADAESEVAALRQSAEELERRLRGESEKDQTLSRRLAGADQRRQERASFLVLADRHLVNDHCPVCGQSISLDEVKASVAQRLGSIPDKLIDLQREKNESESLIASLEQEREALDARLHGAEERLADLDRQIRLRSGILQDFRARLGELGIDSQSPGLRERLTSGHEAAINQARMARSLARECDVLGRRAAFLGARDRLSRLREHTEVQQLALSSVLSEVHKLNSATEVAGSVVVAARRAERDLVRSMLTSIEPVLDVLYGRLRPHPVMDRLRLDIGSFDEKGEVRFVAYSPSTEANVSTIFSSAQLNAVAVCVFMAMNLAISRSQAAFALLDDPIQNMDDFNVLGLLDLLRGLVQERQFVVSTHDEQIGELLRRKLRPLAPGAQTILHRFRSYRGDGPVVETLIDDYVEVPRVLERTAGE